LAAVTGLSSILQFAAGATKTIELNQVTVSTWNVGKTNFFTAQKPKFESFGNKTAYYTVQFLSAQESRNAYILSELRKRK
jgi:hypothetical protein